MTTWPRRSCATAARSSPRVVQSQDAIHAPYGGVVPELASRDHVRHLHATVGAALARAGVGLDALDAIASRPGPG